VLCDVYVHICLCLHLNTVMNNSVLEITLHVRQFQSVLIEATVIVAVNFNFWNIPCCFWKGGFLSSYRVIETIFSQRYHQLSLACDN